MLGCVLASRPEHGGVDGFTAVHVQVSVGMLCIATRAVLILVLTTQNATSPRRLWARNPIEALLNAANGGFAQETRSSLF